MNINFADVDDSFHEDIAKVMAMDFPLDHNSESTGN